MLASLDDWAAVAGIAGVVVASVGLGFVAVQLRHAAAAGRVQATIAFQAAFRGSADSRAHLQKTFPLHVSLLAHVAPNERAHFKTWAELKDLETEERAAAEAVINALNDVAQYVADGLSLRSALQQYHTIFVRVGALLVPYIDAKNAPIDGVRPPRVGVRIIDLYNAGLWYHRRHPKHAGRALELTRDSVKTPERKVKVTLITPDSSGGVGEHPPYPPSVPIAPSGPESVERIVRAAERNLRR